MYKTWVEIDKKAIASNVGFFRSLIGPKTKLWAVVKSNAYGHGLFVFSKLADEFGVDGFCVDSVIEGLALRDAGIKKPILVLGPTLDSALYGQAERKKITVTISSVEALQNLISISKRPEFHIKIDTGMHRQGFLMSEIGELIKRIKNKEVRSKNALTGIYTHFAAPSDKAFTQMQYEAFKKAIAKFEEAGFINLVCHAAATGGVLADTRYCFDAVRVGAGLYGFSAPANKNSVYTLEPVLSWRSVVSEIKNISRGEGVGYDYSWRAKQDSRIAIVPIGYWHGFPRGLSNVGSLLINGKIARVVGNVSMDMLTIDVTDIPVKILDEVTLIGKDGDATRTAEEIAQELNTVSYEILTRLNPLMERVVV